jgi:hypothetical protein
MSIAKAGVSRNPGFELNGTAAPLDWRLNEFCRSAILGVAAGCIGRDFRASFLLSEVARF